MGHKHTQSNENIQLLLILSLYLSTRNDDSFSLGIVPTRNSQSAYYFMCLINCWLHVTRTRKMTKPITMTSYWERWRLKSPASRFFTQSFNQAQIKENIKAPSHWPLCGDRWIPRTNTVTRNMFQFDNVIIHCEIYINSTGLTDAAEMYICVTIRLHNTLTSTVHRQIIFNQFSVKIEKFSSIEVHLDLTRSS